jgi:predicted enzyme related to lactoylglutathione lyase
MAENSPSVSRASAYAEGVPCWVDAHLSDVEAGKRFYGELFGWTFETAGHGAFARARLDGEPVAALVPKTDGRMPSVWTVYFAARDARALAGRIRAAGGQVVTPPEPVADLGTTALVTDPQGAVFALWQRDPGAGESTFAGFGARHRPGAFAWAELYTRDTAAADTFYGGLFHDALFGPDAAPDFGRAPVTDVFPAEMPPHFLVHFRVEDCEAALGTVARLGGRVQVPAFETSYGRVAVATDGQGASFALLQR